MSTTDPKAPETDPADTDDVVSDPIGAPPEAPVAVSTTPATVSTTPAATTGPVAEGPAPADGSRRRRTALLVVAVAAATGLVGGLIGHQIQSPADRAAERAAPIPSLITIPVELRSLSSELVLNGSVDYNEPTLVQLAGSVGIDPGEAAVVTELAPAGQALQEGDVLLEVTGRPVIVLQGDLPMYRRLVVGSEGPDVAQLEAALVRLGYSPGTVDSVFDADTATAVEQMYTDAGYTAEGPSVEERDAVTGAQEGVRQAEDNLRVARQTLADASEPLLESERLQLERSLQSARDAVPAARRAAETAADNGSRDVAAAQASRDTAVIARDAAAATRDAAKAGGTDPDTGQPYTAARIAELEVEAAAAQEQLVAADAALAAARTQRDQSVADANQAIADAEFNLRLTEAQYAEATSAGDTSPLREAVTEAEAAVAAATANLTAVQATAGLRISPGEIVFAPVMPSTLTESYVTLGSTVQGPVGTLATSSTLVSARVSRVDSALVAVGASVQIDIRGSGVTTSGSVLAVGAPPASSADGGVDGGGGGGGDTSGRLVVTVAPDDPDLVADYVFWDARVVVSIASTDGEVLVVPVAALTVGPDEVSQVEVERTPATDDEPAVTEVVKVEVGLTSGGLAEVRPIDGDLGEGDRVVVGVETNERLNEDESSGPTVPEGSDDGDGDEDGGGDDDDGESGDGPASSPIAELLGFDFDPVESRRQQLEIEERVADCMRDEGFEYQPVDYSQFNNPEDELQFTDPEGFGEQYGYGVMRNYELYETGESPAGPEFVDPNQEYVAGLSQEEQNAYYTALYGSGIEEGAAEEAPIGTAGEVGEGGSVAVPTPEEQGCYGIANAEVNGENPANDPEIQEALGDYFTRIEEDPRLDDANRVWAECLTPTLDELGITDGPESTNGMYEIVNRFKYEALGLEVVEVDSEAELNEYFESGEEVYSAEFSEDGGGRVYLGQPAELSGEEIDRLTALEVDLWKADRACQEEAGIQEIRRQIELDLVDELVAQFPELGG